MREADRLQRQSAFPEAGAGLERARSRLGDGGPFWLYPVVEAARRDHQFLVRLEAIRLNRSTLAEGQLHHGACCASTRPRRIGTTPRLSVTRGWASPPTTRTGSQRESGPPNGLPTSSPRWTTGRSVPPTRPGRIGCWAVARRADPDPWRDRVRDPAAWRDGKALAELAPAAPLAEQPVPLLLALGERLTATGEDGVGFLRRVREQYPDDFWANFTLALALHGAERHPGGDPAPALAYYEKALEIRPQAAAVLNDLGLVLIDKVVGEKRTAARATLHQLVKNDPHFAAGLQQPRRGPGTQGRLATGGAHVPGRLGDRSPVGPRPLQPRRNPGRFGILDEAIDHYRQALRSRSRFRPGPPLPRYRPGRQGPV